MDQIYRRIISTNEEDKRYDYTVMYNRIWR